MSRRNRTRREARRTPFKNVKPTILIVTEGEKTEPQYFEAFSKECQNPRVKIEIDRGAGVPRSVVMRAKELKREADKEAKRQNDDNIAFDQVWCVFDRDDHPHFFNSMQMAKDNEIEVALSNPCFELWLLLHFREQPGIQDRHKIQSMMKNFVLEYDKSVSFGEYSTGYSEAHRRAKKLEEAAIRDDEPYRNPTTGVWRLTEKISEN